MITRGAGLFDRLGRHAVLLKPCRRPPMQGRQSIGLLLHRMSTENVCKEVVIAIPLALIIKRNDKQVASLQGLQHLLAVFLAGDRIA